MSLQRRLNLATFGYRGADIETVIENRYITDYLTSTSEVDTIVYKIEYEELPTIDIYSVVELEYDSPADGTVSITSTTKPQILTVKTN